MLATIFLMSIFELYFQLLIILLQLQIHLLYLATHSRLLSVNNLSQNGGQPQQSTYYSPCVISPLVLDIVQPQSQHSPFPSLICGPSSWRHPSSFPDTGGCRLHSSLIGAYSPYLSPLQIWPLINSGVHRLGRRSSYRHL